MPESGKSEIDVLLFETAAVLFEKTSVSKKPAIIPDCRLFFICNCVVPFSVLAAALLLLCYLNLQQFYYLCLRRLTK